MDTQELAEKIRDYIRTTYKAEYNGLLLVKENPYGGYIFVIGLPSYMAPTTIATDLTDQNEFLNYIYEELRIRNYMRLYIYRVDRTENAKEE